MKKELEDMSAEELGLLFPIILCDYNEDWPVLYSKEESVIVQITGNSIYKIQHIGSTSVQGMTAKPTIDILLEIRESADTEMLTENLIKAGYRYLKKPENPPPHMMFLKGYTDDGFVGQAFHLHIRYPGDWDETLFRDYLRIHKEVAEEYVKLKKELQKKYEHDRDRYTESKTEFIKKCNELARNEKNSCLNSKIY